MGIFTLGVLICLACIIVFTLDALRGGKPRIRRLGLRYVKHYGLLKHVSSWEDVVDRVNDAPWLRGAWFYPLCVLCFLANGHMLFLLASLFSAILGLLVSLIYTTR